ncbi:glycoside hydrolase family 16 protein [Infundibulicybe gibba]|nr:glycoside hydrolase family 16 protein [Infundibulicybe gibba]
MKYGGAFKILPLLSLATSALGASYSLTDSIVGSEFYTKFYFQDFDDPTNGRVNYVNGETAKSKNLTFASSDSFIMRADSTKVVSSGRGRDSVRIKSHATYTTHVAVFNVRHMPQGCRTWPAIWETDEDAWPYKGEIDILEGVNDMGPNESTLHTGSGCEMPNARVQTGSSTGVDNCDDYGTNGVGCGVQTGTPLSYGPEFNKNGGGWYAMERTRAFLKVWFWERGSSKVPAEVRDGSLSVTTDNWGKPSAYFPSTDSCNIPEHFGNHNIIINIAFCGDWAGDMEAWAWSKCPSSTCEDFVDKNPSAFKDAYFDIASAKVYA